MLCRHAYWLPSHLNLVLIIQLFPCLYADFLNRFQTSQRQAGILWCLLSSQCDWSHSVVLPAPKYFPQMNATCQEIYYYLFIHQFSHL